MKKANEIWSEVTKRIITKYEDAKGKKIKRMYQGDYNYYDTHDLHVILFEDNEFIFLHNGITRLGYFDDFIKIYKFLFEAGVLKESDKLAIDAEIKAEEEKKAEEERLSNIEYHKRELKKLGGGK